MIQQFRNWFADKPLGITVPVGVLLGSILSQLLFSSIVAFVTPVLLRWRYGDATDGARLTFHIGHVRFDYTNVLVYALGALVIGLILYVLFARRDGTDEQDPAMRDCPECRNEIWSDAKRCGFCTSLIEPTFPNPTTQSTT